MTNLRKYFCETYLRGIGLDIGPLHKPIAPYCSNNATILTVDRYRIDKLREHYPELAEEITISPDVIDDAQTLATIEDATFDFVVASHVLEHMKNPILAIQNWLRVLTPRGYLYLIVPDHKKIFDRDRETTSIAHMVLDYEEPSGLRDLDHYIDYAEFVNGAWGPEKFSEAQHLLDTDYSIHFHCFTRDSLVEFLLLKECGDFKIIKGPVIDQKDDNEFHFLLRKSK